MASVVTRKCIYLMIVILTCIGKLLGQTCPPNGYYAGIETVERGTNSAGNSRYLLTGKGEINCQGVIREWVFYTSAGCTGDIDFEVWRPIAGANQYQLVGINSFKVSTDCPQPSVNEVTFGIPPTERIPVEYGYVIGWNPFDNSSISYNSVNDSQYMTAANIVTIQPGNQLSWNPAAPENSDFSLKVTVMQGVAPTLDNLPTSVNVKEGNPAIVIFTVFTTQINNRNYSDAVYLNFTISPTTAPFSIRNISNGVAEVVTNTSLDYNKQNVYLLSITVTGLGLSTTEILTVNVLQVFQNLTFTNLPNDTSIQAPAFKSGDEVFLVLVDNPNPQSTVGFYHPDWQSPDTNLDIPPFSIDQNSGSVQSTTDLNNWFLQYPNTSSYPSSITYNLTILATDGIVSVSQVLTVTITDLKDPLRFLNLPATVNISETLPVNSVIYQVLVETDLSSITYQITDPVSSPFCINQATGIITLCPYAKLDYCDVNLYNLNISAKNSPMNIVDTLTVNIDWVNEAPEFNPDNYEVTIFHKDKNGTFPFAMINVMFVDRDNNCKPPTDSWTCAVVVGFGSEFFTINTPCSPGTPTTVSYELPIDLDTNPEYGNILLRISVTDLGQLTAYATISITVIKTNDYDPVFNPSSYNGSVKEMLPGGTSVLTVTASDNDTGISGEFTYSIPPGQTPFVSDFFQVDPVNGLITTKQPIDFDDYTVFDFIVVATDKGSPPRNGSADVTVFIIDVNTHRPEFNCSNRPLDEPYVLDPQFPTNLCFYNFDILYDAAVDSDVSTQDLVADSIDPQPCVITYKMLVPNDNFNLNDSNGHLTVKQKLNPYTKDILYTYAEDNGDPSLMSRIMYVRIDTYRRDRQWIDLTVRPKPSIPFVMEDFLSDLRNITTPWFMKIVSHTAFEPPATDIIVTVYALADTSTYLEENIAYKKVFVDRDEMLSRLRKNIYGDPKEILKDPLLEENYPIIKVEPNVVNWWLDTVEGIVTIVCLSALGLILLTASTVGLCKYFKVLCFKSSEKPPPQAWVEDEPSSRVMPPDQESIRYRHGHERRESVTTVHSIILGRDLE